METIKQLLTSYDDARHILGDISRTMLYTLFDECCLERVNIGRRGFVVTESLERYVDSLTQAAEADGQLALFPEPLREEKRFVPLGGKAPPLRD